MDGIAQDGADFHSCGAGCRGYFPGAGTATAGHCAVAGYGGSTDPRAVRRGMGGGSYGRDIGRMGPDVYRLRYQP